MNCKVNFQIYLITPHDADPVAAERDDRGYVVAIEARLLRRQRERCAPHRIIAEAPVDLNFLGLCPRHPKLASGIVLSEDHDRSSDCKIRREASNKSSAMWFG